MNDNGNSSSSNGGPTSGIVNRQIQKHAVTTSPVISPHVGDDLEVERLISVELPRPFSPQRSHSTRISNDGSVIHLRDGNKLVLAMVGLPARGKTFIARRLARYLSWLGYNVAVFNIGNYRRRMFGAECDSSFFDSTNEANVQKRESAAMQALSDMYKFLHNGGHAAIYDGTNSTLERRGKVVQFFNEREGDMNVDLIWIESVCNDQAVIDKNIRSTKLFSPDYQTKDQEQAVQDFRQRIAEYEKVYCTLDDKSQSYVKLINQGQEVQTNRIFGYLPCRIVFFLMNLRISKEPIYISRHGQSEFNVVDRTGGDSSITKCGREYAENLANFIENEVSVQEAQKAGRVLPVWTSCLKRTVETSMPIRKSSLNIDVVEWRRLNEIDSGRFDGYTYEEIRNEAPEEFQSRIRDKLNYRYPGGGESYVDLIQRIEPVIFELERIAGPVLVIAHQAVLRCLCAYFFDMDKEEIPHVLIPMHTVIKLTPQAYHVVEERIQLHPQLSTGVGRLPLHRATSVQYTLTALVEQRKSRESMALDDVDESCSASEQRDE